MIKKFWNVNSDWNEIWLYSISLLIIPPFFTKDINLILFCCGIFGLVTISKIFDWGSKFLSEFCSKVEEIKE